MYLLYSLSLSLVFLLLLPYFVYQAIRHGKYASSFRERLGRLPESLRGDNRTTIWVHAVSVGEFNAARPLIASLRQEMSGYRIVVSTTTITGQQLARAHYPDDFDAVFYFPFDWAFTVRRALNHVRPSLVVILETEFWPNFLRECRRRKVQTVVVNGRISPRSFARYLKVRRFISRVMRDVSLLVMQSESDAERARSLGAPFENVRVCGNLKYDIPGAGGQGPGVRGRLAQDALARRAGPGASNKMDRETSGFRDKVSDAANPPDPWPLTPDPCEEVFALSSSQHLIIAGSTAPGEERMLLDALKQIQNHSGLEDARLIIAPRRPERFNEVAELIAQSGFAFARRSQVKAKAIERVKGTAINDQTPSLESVLGSDRAADPRRADVILLDTIGELADLYRFAAVVFVGGSLVPRGGHNIIEPAVYAKPIIVGPHTENFRQIVSDFVRADAAVQMSTAGATPLARELLRLLSDRELAGRIGARAREILIKSRGATECIIKAIQEVMRND